MKRTPPKKSPRADAKYDEVATAIRDEIIAGHWAAGTQLPTWDALCERYDVGRPTLTRALDVLKAEGFVAARTTRGTYVVDTPPNLNRYVLLFPSEPGRRGVGGWNLFWESIAMEALSTQNGGRRFDVRFQVTPHRDCPAYATLLEDMAKRRIAGVLCVHGGALARWQPPIPFPHVSLCASAPPADIPSVGIDWPSFYTAAAGILREGSRKRIAILASEQPAAEAAAALFREGGLSIPERFRLSMPGAFCEGAENLMRLLLSLPRAERPDGLLVCDDNLLPGTLAAVLAEKLSIPKDLLIIAHGNSPAAPRAAIPGVRRLGFDTAQMLRAALQILERQKTSPSRVETIAIPATDQLTFL